jgi:hypothetical protein
MLCIVEEQGDQKIERKLPNFWKKEPKELPCQKMPKIKMKAQWGSITP